MPKLRNYFMMFLIFILVLFLFISRPRERLRKDEIDNSVRNGLVFLNRSYSEEYLFNDPYIKCTGQLPDCNVKYRELDASIVLVFFLSEKIKKDPLMSGVISHSERIVSSQFEEWKNSSIENLPIDLYSTFVYYYPNRSEHMLKELVRGLRQDGSWEDYSIYEPDFEWRKVTDESWPIVALAKNKVDWDLIKLALDRKKYEGGMIMDGTWDWDKIGRYYGILTTYHAFLWVSEDGYNMSGYVEFIKEMEDFLSKQPEDENMSKWTILTADTLYWLCEGNYKEKKILNDIAKVIIDRQEDDGGWRTSIYEIGERTSSGATITKERYDSGRSHATIMAVLALENYGNCV